jgi:hypothetical protein
VSSRPTPSGEGEHVESEPLTVRRAATHVLFGIGGGVANVVYGTVVVLAALTAAYGSENHPWRLAVVVFTSVVVLWVAHVYAHALSHSLETQKQLSAGELVHVGRRELGIVLSAIGPMVALLLGAAKVFDETVAIWLAFGVGLLTLAVEGVRYAQLERVGPLGTLVAIALNVALGLFLVALKVAVAH